MTATDAHEKALETLVKLLDSDSEQTRLSAAQSIINRPQVLTTESQ